jgi:hypothetical protein
LSAFVFISPSYVRVLVCTPGFYSKGTRKLSSKKATIFAHHVIFYAVSPRLLQFIEDDPTQSNATRKAHFPIRYSVQ